MIKNPLLLFIGIALGPFIIGIDFLVMGVAIEPMAKSLVLDIKTVQWFLTAFAIGNSGFLVTAGRLADRFGRKQMYMSGLLLFIASSAAIAITDHVFLIIIARLLQGISGGIMTTSAIAIIASLYEPQDRTKWMAGMVGVTGLGMVLGPMFGGLLINYFDWRAIFILNLPIGLLGILFTVFFVPTQTSVTKQKLDLVGMVLFMLILTLFTMGISHGYGALLIVSLVLLIIFFYIEHKTANPLFDVKLFKVKNFFAANLVGFALYFTVTAWILIYGIYLQHVMRFSPIQSGMSMLPFGIVLAVVALFMGKLIKQYSAKRLIIVGLLAGAVAFLGLAVVADWPCYPCLAVLFALYGACFVLVNSCSVPVALEFMPTSKIGIVSGKTMMMRWLGGALGSSIMATIFATQTQDQSYQHALLICMLILSGLLWITLAISVIYITKSVNNP